MPSLFAANAICRIPYATDFPTFVRFLKFYSGLSHDLFFAAAKVRKKSHIRKSLGKKNSHGITAMGEHEKVYSTHRNECLR